MNSEQFRQNMDTDERFERILSERRYEEPSADLDNKIISASLTSVAKRPFSLRLFLSELFAEYSLSPAHSFIAIAILMILTIVIGFVIGFTDPIGNAVSEQVQINLQDFLYYKGEIL